MKVITRSPLGEVIVRSQVSGKLNMKVGWTEMRKWDEAAAALVDTYETLLDLHKQIIAGIGGAPAPIQDQIEKLDVAMAALEKAQVTNTTEARAAHTTRVEQQLAVARALLKKMGTPSEPEQPDAPETVAMGSGGEPPDDKQGGEPLGHKDDVKPPQQLLEQLVVWNVPAQVYGATLNSLPRAVIVQGNQGATITYEPPLDATIPPAGDLTAHASVPGNEVFRALVRKPFVVSVGHRPLVVTVIDNEMAEGGKVPPMEYHADGLAPGDEIDVAYIGTPDTTSAVKLDGYEVTPGVAFRRGSAENYAITLQPGRVIVTRSFTDMEAEIGRLRRAILDMKKGPAQTRLLAQLDDVEKARDAREETPSALETILRKLDADYFEAIYVPVTEVNVSLGPGAARIDHDEPVQLVATIEPATATVKDVNWTTDQRDLVAVSDAGVVSRAPGSLAGGKAVVRAISRSRESVPGSITIDVEPLPARVTIDAPAKVFFGSQHKLSAQVEPLDAPQGVTWKITEGQRRIVTLSEAAELTIERPQQPNQGRPGKLTITATSQRRPEAVGTAEIELAGYATETIAIDGPKSIELATDLRFTAKCAPDQALQGVAWTFSGEGIGAVVTQDATSITVKLENPGRAELTAIAADGSGVEASRRFGVPVPLKALRITSAKSVIDLTERLTLVAEFDPPAAWRPVAWSSSKQSVLSVDKAGIVTPAGSGEATATATAEDKSATIELTVQVSGTSVMTDQQWTPVQELIKAFAEKIGIIDNENAMKTYGKYLYALRQDIRNGGRDTGVGGRVPVDLDTVRTDLIALRNKNFTLESRVWLEKAGFRASTNCMIRASGSVALASMTFSDAHLTLFDTGAQLPIGQTDDALVSAVIRAKVKGMQGLHVTAYGASKAEEMKVYNGGEEWTPPFETVATWAEAWDPDYQPAWRTDNKKRYLCYAFLSRVRTQLITWFEDQKDPRVDALKAYYVAVKQHDDDAIA